MSSVLQFGTISLRSRCLPTRLLSANSKPVLYSFYRSSCVWRIRSALNLKKISYDIKPINLNGEQHDHEFLTINPMGHVPALVIDGHTLIESIAILHYLEETRPQYPLLPKDPLKRAKVREIVEIIASGIQPLQNDCVLNRVDVEKHEEWVQFWIGRGFEAIEKLLSASAGKYCVGDEITLADCCLVPMVFNARLWKLDLTPYPTIIRIDQELKDHPAFRDSHPSSQPDYPPAESK
ncbi:probable maleylacetoacetate isomerase 2 [Malaya genurostris]|uniref:probable maleylacetoacetate isomerase 2 n=1 Tax=Malaya genurostris TaxID=325434 RepID=UPI0026F3988D|nr:probable maleylacetoacetate isomerase 2 [Malaya genurostris]